MKTVGVFEAKTHLSELIDNGEIVTITKHGRPVATLNPIRRDASEVMAELRANPAIVGATSDDIARMIRADRDDR